MVTESVEAGVLALLNPVFTIGSACIPAGPGDDGQLIDLLSGSSFVVDLDDHV